MVCFTGVDKFSVPLQLILKWYKNYLVYVQLWRVRFLKALLTNK